MHRVLREQDAASVCGASAAEVRDSLSRPRRNALVEEFALRFLGLAAFDRQHVRSAVMAISSGGKAG
jgi:hypothetical protein